MPSRAFQYLNVAIAAIAAAGVVVGLTLDTRTTPRQPPAHSGKPPVPTASSFQGSGLPASVSERIETAFRNWPHGSIDTMQELGAEYAATATPVERRQSALVEYFRGIALIWAGYPFDAQQALQDAKKWGKNTLIQGRADNLLHPDFFQPPSGPPYPQFVPSTPDKLLEQGSVLQEQGHQESAEKLFARVAAANPNEPQAQVAKAVGLFNESDLTPSFAALGPLTARFPKSQIVRFYLGYLLAWTNQGEKALVQFKRAVALGPTTPLGKESQSFVAQIQGGAPAPAK